MSSVGNMKSYLLNLWLLVIHFHYTVCTVQLKNDYFYGVSREALFQKQWNSEGNHWQLPVNVQRLAILSNDEVVDEDYKSCFDGIFQPTSQNQDSNINTNVSFKDITKVKNISSVSPMFCAYMVSSKYFDILLDQSLLENIC